MTYDHATKAGNLGDLHKHAVLTALTVSLREVKGGTVLNVLDAYAGTQGYYEVPPDDPRFKDLTLLTDHLDWGNDYPSCLGHWLNLLHEAEGGGVMYPGSPSILRSILSPGSYLKVNDPAASMDSVMHTSRKPALALLPEVEEKVAIHRELGKWKDT